MTTDNTIDEAAEALPPIPRTLEPPPRSSGNAQADYPLLIDWIYRAYQVIVQSVDYINRQINENEDLDLQNLPDPATSTVAQAQFTANQAYVLASGNQDDIEAVQAEVDAAEVDIAAVQTHLGLFENGTVTISDLATTSGTVSFAAAQPDTSYTVMVQAKSRTGAPAAGAYVVATKTYATGDFSFTITAAPGAGTSITFDWQLVRKL